MAEIPYIWWPPHWKPETSPRGLDTLAQVDFIAAETPR